MTNNYAIHIVDVEGDDAAPLGSRGRGAAFRAVKALMGGQVVLLAADGSLRSDAAAVEIAVRGFPVSISAGAALIAYEAWSNTGWYHVDWRDGSFALVFKPGPARMREESFAQFRDRWLAFYAAQYEAALSANPAYLISFLKDKKR